MSIELANRTEFVAIRREQAPLEFNDEQRRMIRDSYANGASDEEFAVLMAVASARRLNPLLKQVYFVRRFDSQKNRHVWTTQVAIDGLRAIAERTGLYAGQDEPEYLEKDGAVVCCKVRVYRKDWQRPAVGIAYFSEYVQADRDGKPTSFWKRMPHVMLAKCAESVAIRKAFPEDTSGLYTAEEMGQAENERPYLESTGHAVHQLPCGPMEQEAADNTESVEHLAQAVQVWREYGNKVEEEREGAGQKLRALLVKQLEQHGQASARTKLNDAINEDYQRRNATTCENVASEAQRPAPLLPLPTVCVHSPEFAAFATDVAYVDKLPAAVICWCEHRVAISALSGAEKAEAWTMLAKRVEAIGGVKNGKAWLKKAIGDEDKRTPPDGPNGGGKPAPKAQPANDDAPAAPEADAVPAAVALAAYDDLLASIASKSDPGAVAGAYAKRYSALGEYRAKAKGDAADRMSALNPDYADEHRASRLLDAMAHRAVAAAAAKPAMPQRRAA